MKHVKSLNRPAVAGPDLVLFSWCTPPNVSDGGCTSLEFADGVLRVRQTGGFAGVNIFTPLLKG